MLTETKGQKLICRAHIRLKSVWERADMQIDNFGFDERIVIVVAVVFQSRADSVRVNSKAFGHWEDPENREDPASIVD